MSVTVNSKASSSISVGSGSQSSAALTIKKSTGGTLQSLSNVVTTNLQDGYTLIYDSETSKWVAQPVSASVGTVDGGTY